jgi:hypothetical protein
MELKYIALGIFLAFVVMAAFASNVGESAKNAWSNLWCIGSSTEVDSFGTTKKEECMESVASSTDVGSSLCMLLLAVGLVTYVVKQQS